MNMLLNQKIKLIGFFKIIELKNIHFMEEGLFIKKNLLYIRLIYLKNNGDKKFIWSLIKNKNRVSEK